MQGLANFMDDLLGGVELVALSLAVGGVVWGLFVLGGWRRLPAADGAVVARCLTLLSAGAGGLALAQLTQLAGKAWILAEALGQPPFPAFLHTLQFQAGLARASLAAALAAAVTWLRHRPGSRGRWAGVGLLAILLTASGAWLSHAAGRFDNRASLMVVTTLHALGGAVWLGGVVQLGAAWRLTRRRPECRALWPILLARFSPVGMAAVLLLATAAIPLGWSYVATWRGLLGTGYGALVIAKVVLGAAALGFAALNFRAVRRWRRSGLRAEVDTRVPYFVEAETIMLGVIVLTAASLASQPPAVDATTAQATWSEVVEVFSPKWPRVISPSHQEVLAAWSPRLAVTDEGRTPGDAWSEFNHDVAGLFVLAMGVLALAARTTRVPWARQWPLGFVALAAFVAVRSDPETWPLGPIGFWERTFSDATVLQHRLGAALALALGVLEWRARLTQETGARRRYVFPVLSAVGGIVLLTHSHSPFELKDEFLIQISHTALGWLAVFVACGRWLELRLAPPAGRRAGLVSILAMLLIGTVLAVYREPAG